MVDRQIGSLREKDKAAKGQSGGGGKIVQIVVGAKGTLVSGTTIIPLDNTIPQKTEGVELLTQAITPQSATNRLLIQSTINVAPGGVSVPSIVALFQDTTAGALVAGMSHEVQAFNVGNSVVYIVHDMVAGTTSATTFKLRGGTSTSETFYMNAHAGAAVFGGVNSSKIVIMEYIP
jgi:hypothetical protein